MGVVRDFGGWCQIHSKCFLTEIEIMFSTQCLRKERGLHIFVAAVPLNTLPFLCKIENNPSAHGNDFYNRVP